jgi:hypothetical protein
MTEQSMLSIETGSSRPESSDKDFARSLRPQIAAWQAAKPARRAATDSGVTVVRLKRTNGMRRTADVR